MSIRQGFFSLYSLPSLGLVFPLLRFPLLRTRHNLGGGGGGGWLVKKNGRDCSGFSDLAFHFVKPYCYVSLVVQSNLHTLVVLSFTEEFHTTFRLRQRELEKNWTDQQNWAMNLNRLCKDTLWFLTMEDQKTVFIPLSKYMASSKQLTHEDLRKAAS